jgi:glycyl-tRNA synthetase beta chain
MAKDLLLEIGMEEIPARFVRGAMDQLKDRTAKWLSDSRIAYAGIQSYATPRRITVIVQGVEEKQSDLNEEVRGPSQKIAQGPDGAWTQAALGFARSQGVPPEALALKELNGVEYVFASKSSMGQDTAAVLPEGLTSIITAMGFPKNMRWGSRELKYVRPIRWMVVLFGEDIVPIEVAGVHSSRTSKGHRFLGQDADIASPSVYEETLKQQFVFVNVEERKSIIEQQIRKLAEANGWTIPIKEDLLEEVLFLVEYPTALFGHFNPEFLSIPQEVLITSMREHQRYFPVLDNAGKILPHFVTVRNGDDRSLDNVARGNEKVLRARLSDARFFYDEDQKMTIADALERLEKIVFHEQLGTIADKVRRIQANAEAISQLWSFDEANREWTARSAAICKFDLVTQMVYEFPELQGVMGQDYARKAGEKDEVAKAIFEHYQPRFSGDQVPSSKAGAAVSIADKIDTIAGCFSLGIIPTGSQDPYALRRQASGIVQILLEHHMPITLSQLFEAALNTLEQNKLLKRDAAEVRKDLYEFFGLRVKNMLSEHGVRYDIVDSLLASGFEHIPSALARAEALVSAVRQPEFKATVESFNRVSNLAAKASLEAEINPALFEDDAEHSLHHAFLQMRERYIAEMSEEKADAALQTLAAMKDPITRFFDAVMVMAEDEQVRSNRLALLAAISGELKKYADFAKLVW